MLTKIQKWGTTCHSHSSWVCRRADGTQGSEVDLSLDGDRLVVSPDARAISLALLAQVTDENIHTEVATGEPTGREVW